nr:hypothetical protein [Micromonospora sp. DSM 115978]
MSDFEAEHDDIYEQDWYDARFYAIVTDLVGTPTELFEPGGTPVWQRRASLWGVPARPSTEDTDCPLRF